MRYAIGVAIAVPIDPPVTGGEIPDASEHLTFFPARLIALFGNIAGTVVSGDEASVATGERSGTIDSATNKDGNMVSGAWNCASTGS